MISISGMIQLLVFQVSRLPQNAVPARRSPQRQRLLDTSWGLLMTLRG